MFSIRTMIWAGLFETKPCGTWKKGISDNIKESSFYGNITKDFITTLIKVNLFWYTAFSVLNSLRVRFVWPEKLNFASLLYCNTIFHQVGGWTLLSALLYGGAVFSSTALQKSGLQPYLPTLTVNIFAVCATPVQTCTCLFIVGIYKNTIALIY